MKITRIYTGEDKQSHFEDLKIELDNQQEDGELSRLFRGKGFIFRKTKKDYNYPWHNAPRRQMIIYMSGKVQVEIGSGEKRVFQKGDILLAEDITGQGHSSTSNEDVFSLYIPLEEDELIKGS